MIFKGVFKLIQILTRYPKVRNESILGRDNTNELKHNIIEI